MAILAHLLSDGEQAKLQTLTWTNGTARLDGGRAATFLLVIRSVPNICGRSSTDSPPFTPTVSHSQPPVIEAGVTGFLFDYLCIPREARKSRIYTDWDPDWSPVRTRLVKPPTLPPSFFSSLTAVSCPKTSPRPSVLFLLARASPECTSSPHLTSSAATKLIAGQTHRHCMYTSFDVFQTVSKGQCFHKTHGEPFSGCAIR